MTNIQIELDEKYREALDLLKQVIPSADGAQIDDDNQIVEALVDSFMAFIQEQAWDHDHGGEEKSGGCGWNGEGWCGCSH